jgi:hypothetical protein
MVSVGRLKSKTEAVREGPTAESKYNEVESSELLCVVWVGCVNGAEDEKSVEGE